MEAVYWALGIHDPDFVAKYGETEAVYKVLQAKAAWAVLSFRAIEADDPGLAAAEQAAGIQLRDPRRYSFQIYRWGKEIPDPGDMRILFLEMLEQAIAYVSGNTVLMRRDGGSWKVDQSMPTSSSSAAGRRVPPPPSPARRADIASYCASASRVAASGRARRCIPGSSRCWPSSGSPIVWPPWSARATPASGSNGADRVASKPSAAMRAGHGADSRSGARISTRLLLARAARGRRRCPTALRGDGTAGRATGAIRRVRDDGGADRRRGSSSMPAAWRAGLAAPSA